MKPTSIALSPEVIEEIAALPQIQSGDFSRSYLTDQIWRLLLGLPSDFNALSTPEFFLMNKTVSILVEIPEDLHTILTLYLEDHPKWDQDRIIAAGLSLFLLQNGECDRRAARVHLDILFKHLV